MLPLCNKQPPQLLEKRREQLATAEKDEEETEESLAWPELDELFNSSLPEYDGIAADDEVRQG